VEHISDTIIFIGLYLYELCHLCVVVHNIVSKYCIKHILYKYLVNYSFITGFGKNAVINVYIKFLF